MKWEPILGIDLGTTNCAAAYYNENANIILIHNDDGELVTPSVVLIDKGSIVGKKAKMQRAQGKNTFSNIKSKIGQDFSFRSKNKTFRVEELSAHLLKKMKTNAEAVIGRDIDNCIITVPAYFNDAQRQATIDAGKIAGFNVYGIINEPTAAALAYIDKSGFSKGIMLVYDLGGGTFDATLLRVSGDSVDVLATEGIRDTGGVLFDKKIAEYFYSQLKSVHGIDVSLPKYMPIQLVAQDKAEQVKLDLSFDDMACAEFIIDDKKIEIPVTRAWFESAIEPACNRTFTQIDILSRKAKLSFKDIDVLLAVGGSCKIPFIISKLEALTGASCVVEDCFDKDTAVAYGAAVYSKVLLKRTNTSIIDVCSRGIGIVADKSDMRGLGNTVIIPKNSPLPITKEKLFVLPESGQAMLYIQITEGELPNLEDVNILGRFTIILPPALPANTVVHVRLTLNSDQILHVRTVIPFAKIDIENEIKRKVNLSKLEIDTANKEINEFYPKELKITADIKEDVPIPEKADTEKSDNDACSDFIENEFAGLIGLIEVKKSLEMLYRQILFEKKRTKELDVSGNIGGVNIQLLGNPGTGKTTVARIIAKMLRKMDIRKSDSFVECDRGRIVGQVIGATEQNMNDFIEQAKGGTLFIDEAYLLYKPDSERDFGHEALGVLLKAMEDMRDSTTFILAGYKDRMAELMKFNSGFPSRLQYTIEIPDYSNDELILIAEQIALGYSYCLDKSAEAAIHKLCEKERVDDSFSNARFIRTIVERAVAKHANDFSRKKNITKDEMVTLYSSDFGVDLSQTPQDAAKEALAKIDAMIGLPAVKNKVESMINKIKLQKVYLEKGMQDPSSSASNHMVFYGNPGTGKTTVARIIAQIYGSIGLLKRPDKFIECKREYFIGDHVGETEKKTKEIIESAMGGILFIDEAYSLYEGENDKEGKKVIDALIAEMENNRDKLIVILAGYRDEIDVFLQANIGFRSRINTYIEFEDYTLDELLEIFINMTKEKDLRLTDDARQAILHLLKEKMQSADFANARGVRNLYEDVLERRTNRLVRYMESENTLTQDVLQTIEAEDVFRQ